MGVCTEHIRYTFFYFGPLYASSRWGVSLPDQPRCHETAVMGDLRLTGEWRRPMVSPRDKLEVEHSG
jgi:hypothetical protein